MRAFKNKWFHRWARREKISDALLLQTAKEIVAGQVEADLGGCLFIGELMNQQSIWEIKDHE